jgi:hypothetical protein
MAIAAAANSRWVEEKAAKSKSPTLPADGCPIQIPPGRQEWPVVEQDGAAK